MWITSVEKWINGYMEAARSQRRGVGVAEKLARAER